MFTALDGSHLQPAHRRSDRAEDAGAAGGGWKTKNTATLYFYYDPWRENMVARFSNKTTTAAKRDNS